MANFFSKLGAQLDELLNGPELFEGEREARENLKEVKKAASSAADRVRQAKERLEREKAAIKEAKKIKKQSDDLYKQMSKDFDQVEKISERIIKLKAVKGQVIGEAKKHVENRVSDANDLLEGIDAMLELIDED